MSYITLNFTSVTRTEQRQESQPQIEHQQHAHSLNEQQPLPLQEPASQQGPGQRGGSSQRGTSRRGRAPSRTRNVPGEARGYSRWTLILLSGFC